MWKWVIGLTLLGMLIMSGVAFAATTEEVTISATGANVTACDPPTNLVVTIVSDFEVSLTWTTASGNGTIIRVSQVSCPVDETDGISVYDGNETSTTFAIDTTEILCFRAWTDCGDGEVSSTFAQATTEGEDDLIFFALIVLCLGLTAISVKSSFRPYVIGASASWIGLMAYTFVYPPGDITAGSPTQLIIALCFIAMAVVVMLMSLGREVQSQETVDGFTTSNSQWKLPKLQMREKSEDEKAAQARNNRSSRERQEDYRKNLRKKLGRDDK